MKTMMSGRHVPGVVTALALVLTGCVSPANSASPLFTRYDEHTVSHVEAGKEGLTVFVTYEQRQGALQSGAVASACKQVLLTVAAEEAAKRGHGVGSVAADDAHLSMGRNGVAGTITCSASVFVKASA